MRKIKKGDTVRIVKGKSSGKEGEILSVKKVVKRKKESVKVTVKGVNMVKRSVKPNPQMGIAGGIIEFERPVDISNVRLIEGKNAVRVGFKVEKGKKTRISKKTGKSI